MAQPQSNLVHSWHDLSGRSCPPGRPARPADEQAARAWYREVEEPRGSGVDLSTNRLADYFYGEYNPAAGMWSRSRSRLFTSRDQNVIFDQIMQATFLSQVVFCDKELCMAPLK